MGQIDGAVVVTGGSGTIGSALCRLLASDHVNIAFSYRSNKVKAEALKQELAASGCRSLAVAVDLTDSGQTGAFIEQAADRFGAIGALVHAGGPHVPQVFLSTITADRFRHHTEQELLAFFNLTAAALPHLRRSHGAIVAITTVAVRKYPTRDALSSAPKAAIEGLVRAIAVEEGRYGIRANCVGPGIMADGMAAELIAAGDFDEVSQQAALREIPLRRFGHGRDCAELAYFLISKRAAYISGQTIDVDGGYSL